MKGFKTLVALLLVFSIIGTASAANITYSEEYYSLGDITNVSWRMVSGAYYGTGQEYPTVQFLTFLELRRQTILMEKQNELIAEQNEMLRNAGNIPRNCVKQNYTVNGDTIYKCGKD